MPEVAVVIPYRGGCPHRERAWQYVRERYASTHPDWEVVEASAPEGPWCKGAAVGPAVEATDAEVVIVADADVWTDGLERAVYAVVSGVAAWSVPHNLVHRLTTAGTDAYLAGEPWEGNRKLLTRRAYPGVWGGGVVVAQRDALLEAPIDPRFCGWGQEDQSWALALHCLHGTGWRGDAPLVHLFHPSEERLTGQKGSRESWGLFQRYRQARRDPEAMRALICEGTGVAA